MDEAGDANYPSATSVTKRRSPPRRSTTPAARRNKPQTRVRRRVTTTDSAVSPRVSGSGLAPGMLPINTYLAVANVSASIEFLERSFGFSRGVVLDDTDGQPRYAEMRHDQAVVVLIRKGDATTPTGGAAALYTYVEDVDRAVSQARLAGAGVDEPEDKPWGDRVAVVTDPDGYRWVLATFKKLAPFA